MNEQTIKLFIKAKTPEALQVLMLNNNIVRSTHYNYEVMFANGIWYAWYLADATQFLTEEAKKLELLRLNQGR